MMSKEEFQRQLKAIAVAHAREIIANQDENRRKAETAKTLFEALRDSPTWTIARTTKPKGFVEPESEIWSQPVTIRRPDDDT